MDLKYEAVLPSGTTLQLYLEQIDHELYRVAGALGLMLPRPCGGLYVPEEAALGWLVDAERLDELRIRVREVRPDPEADDVIYWFPEDFTASEPFRILCREIRGAGGNWELLSRTLFSAWVPRARYRGGRASLSWAIRKVYTGWHEPWRGCGWDDDEEDDHPW
jgi:hypothetical protein